MKEYHNPGSETSSEMTPLTTNPKGVHDALSKLYQEWIERAPYNDISTYRCWLESAPFQGYDLSHSKELSRIAKEDTIRSAGVLHTSSHADWYRSAVRSLRTRYSEWLERAPLDPSVSSYYEWLQSAPMYDEAHTLTCTSVKTQETRHPFNRGVPVVRSDRVSRIRHAGDWTVKYVSL